MEDNHYQNILDAHLEKTERQVNCDFCFDLTDNTDTGICDICQNIIEDTCDD